MAAENTVEPAVLLCPVTHAMFRDPVFIPESGNTYERSAIRQYWSASSGQRDPLTNVPCCGILHTNWGLRREVQSFLDEHAEYLPQGWEDRALPAPAPLEKLPTPKRCGTRRITFWICSCLISTAVFIEHLKQESAFYWPELEETEIAEMQTLKVPKGSRLQAYQVKDRLVIKIPAPGFQASNMCQLTFSMLWLSFVAYWSISAWYSGVRMFVAFSLPFWAVGIMLLLSTLLTPSLSQSLIASNVEYQVNSEVMQMAFSHFTAKVHDLEEVPGLYCMSDADCRLTLQDGVQEVMFGADLKPIEVKWIQRQLCSHWGLNLSECLAKAANATYNRED